MYSASLSLAWWHAGDAHHRPERQGAQQLLPADPETSPWLFQLQAPRLRCQLADSCPEPNSDTQRVAAIVALDMLQGLGRARCFKPIGVEFARECCRYHHAVVFSAAERLSLLQSVAARHAVSTRSPTLRPSRTRTYYVTFQPKFSATEKPFNPGHQIQLDNTPKSFEP